MEVVVGTNATVGVDVAVDTDGAFDGDDTVGVYATGGVNVAVDSIPDIDGLGAIGWNRQCGCRVADICCDTGVCGNCGSAKDSDGDFN